MLATLILRAKMALVTRNVLSKYVGETYRL